MRATITRKGLLRRAVGGAIAAGAAGGLAQPASAAAVTLDARYDSPYPPYPRIDHPSSWYAFTGLTEVTIPAGVYVCNRQLAPMKDVEGHPDLGKLPTDVTLLCVFHEWLPPDTDVSGAPSLNARTMRFTDLGGGGPTEPHAFRQFTNWWPASWNGELYGLLVYLWVGPDAGSEWQEAQPIVDSIRLPA